MQMGQLRNRQEDSMKMFAHDEKNIFRVGQYVLIRAKKTAFYKFSPIFSPIWQDTPYVIRSVDRRIHPFCYALSRIDSDVISKKLYGFEMMKFHYVPKNISNESSLNPITDPLTSTGEVKVIEVLLRDHSILRSKRLIQGKSLIFYRIECDGKLDVISEKALRLLKKSLGSSISYGSFFDNPNNKQYVI